MTTKSPTMTSMSDKVANNASGTSNDSSEDVGTQVVGEDGRRRRSTAEQLHESLHRLNSDYEDEYESDEDDLECEDVDANKGKRNDKEIATKIAKGEDKAVRRLRLVVLTVLAVCTIAVALGVYYYTSTTETSEFEGQFQEEGRKVLESLGVSVDQSLGALATFTVDVVSYARSTNQTWPFVTIDDYYIRVAKIRSISAVLYVTISPIITPANRLEWEAYSFANEAWVDKSIALMETDPHWQGSIVKEWEHNIIHDNYGDRPYNSTSIMVPVWQTSPVVPFYPPFNWDYLGLLYPESVYEALKGNSVITSAYLFPDPDDPADVQEAELNARWYKDFIPPGEEPVEPLSDIYYPILDEVDIVSFENATNLTDPVGIVSASWYWRDLLKNILPHGSEGVVVVFSNECTADFTYEINGPEVVYLGYGDLHDAKYDYLEVSSTLYELDAFGVLGKSKYTGVPVDEEFCPFSIRVYPSQKKEDQYTSDNPLFFTLASVAIFLFTSFVFFMFDWSVERRQAKVMTTAVNSSKVVSSLFPEQFRERLFEGKRESKVLKKKNEFLAADNKEAAMVAPGVLRPKNGAPIADLFPETTVFFADLVGFTAWSAKRTPIEVFTLLECLYASFDSIANKKNVFKVETIGDCYLAVTGLPTPMEHHAVVMARFARECLDVMALCTRELEAELGEGTRDLRLRVGLNSGPTTAGVLRGEKGRFQLFGDTVNTASRMESTSLPGRIQVSESTADSIKKFGKERWLTRREDAVQAKGKGLMVTYWCMPPSGKTQTISSASGEDFIDDEPVPQADLGRRGAGNGGFAQDIAHNTAALGTSYSLVNPDGGEFETIAEA